MLDIEKYSKILLDINDITENQIEEQISLIYLFHSFTNKRLEELKKIALECKLTFTNELYNTKGYIAKGNSSTVIDKEKLISKIGLVNYLEASTVSEKTMKDLFPENTDFLQSFKESTSKKPSDKEIYKIESLKK